MKKIAIVLAMLLATCIDMHAVLKEKNLDVTMRVLRTELTNNHLEQVSQAEERKQDMENIIEQLKATVMQSNQNALMLYSQNPSYVFDLTYACHEATQQYQDFLKKQQPFQAYLVNTDKEITKYDSLITSLKSMHLSMISQQAKTDRTVCLTLATNIKNTLMRNRSQISSYITFFEATEQRLKYLNDYANERYNEIQTRIFKNGGNNYFAVLGDFSNQWKETVSTVKEKYSPKGQQSDWDSSVIFRLFMTIGFYIIVAVLLNLLIFRLMPKRFHSRSFLKKRSCIIMATTTITFAAIMALLKATLNQNFFIMASSLLIEYAWLLGVILISLLLRVNGDQIRSAFRIYTPLLVIGFLVIAFRIVLIPRELVNMVFPPLLLLCALWQWSVISRHRKNVPQSDMFYAYLSQAIFVTSLISSWMGYTLLAVQILIWWIMQLTCILTITCLSQYLKLYAKQHHYSEKPVTQTWFYMLVYKVVLPVLGVLSVMVSIYWAAGVFNLSDLCWQIFNKNFIDMPNLRLSVVKITIVINLWFLFSYISSTILSLLRLHYQTQDPTTAASREVMGRNVIQVLVWGVWLLFSLSLLHVSVYWLMALGGGLSTGIGFALKDIIENIYYGATLMAGRIKVGDWIEVDGVMGKVASISYTSTVIESLYGEVITFQNSQLFAKNYKNLTKNHGYILAAIPFSVAYGSNLKQVNTLVDQAVNALRHQWMDKSKTAKSVITAMNDSSVDFKIFVWVDAVKKVYVVSEVMRCIYDTLNSNGIQIPFPQRDIHIKNLEELTAAAAPAPKE